MEECELGERYELPEEREGDEREEEDRKDELDDLLDDLLEELCELELCLLGGIYIPPYAIILRLLMVIMV